MNVKDLPPFDQIPPHGIVFNNDTGERVMHFHQFRDGHMYVLIFPNGHFKWSIGETTSYDTDFRVAVRGMLDEGPGPEQPTTT